LFYDKYIYILSLICFSRMDFSQSIIASKAKLEMWNDMRSSFRTKHINDSMLIKDLVRWRLYNVTLENSNIMLLSANWTFFLWFVPLKKSGSLNLPWSTKNISSVWNSHVQVYRSIWRKTHNDVTDKNNNVSSEASTVFITSITACPIGLTWILVIMFVSTFKTAVILYV
jgi:hypothetical protein